MYVDLGLELTLAASTVEHARKLTGPSCFRNAFIEPEKDLLPLSDQRDFVARSRPRLYSWIAKNSGSSPYMHHQRRLKRVLILI